MRDLSLKGEITKIAKLETGTSKAGKEWKKLGFVITTEGDYPKDVYFTVFGEEKTSNFMTYNRVGQIVEVFFNINAREFNNKWYTDLGAWKIVSEKITESTTPVTETTNNEFHKVEDLPF
tara:strand:- start:3313 stop:3672 length:360 start_codon:yes stop_codon:yes gene_type:complete